MANSILQKIASPFKKLKDGAATVFDFITKPYHRLKDWFEKIKEQNVQTIIFEGKKRKRTIATSALFFLIATAIDLWIPIAGSMALLSIPFTPAVIIPVGALFGILILALTIDHIFKLSHKLDELKKQHADKEKVEQELNELNIEVDSLLSDIDALHAGLAEYGIVEPMSKSLTADAFSKADGAEGGKLAKAKGLLAKISNLVPNAIRNAFNVMQGVQGAKDGIVDAKDKVSAFEKFIKQAIKIYGILKFTLITVALAPALPIIAVVFYAKKALLDPVTQFEQDLNQARAEQPALLERARDVKAAAIAEKGRLEAKLETAQAKAELEALRAKIQAPVASTSSAPAASLVGILGSAVSGLLTTLWGAKTAATVTKQQPQLVDGSAYTINPAIAVGSLDV